MRDSLNITAHSGCDGTELDSMESVYAGIRCGADCIEVDVRRNKRGVLILSHDKDESLEYAGYTLLADVFAAVVRNGGVAVNCDVKERETVPAILRLGEEAGMETGRLILTGASTPSMLAEDPGIFKKAVPWLNIEEFIENRKGDLEASDLEALDLEALIDHVISGCRRVGAGVVNMPYMEQTAPLIPRFMAGGLRVSVWTLNEREALERAFGLGVLNVTTRNTHLAVEARNRST